VFVDAVMANVLVFAVGQVFAWLFLRSGRFWMGAGATVALWTFIDWWLVSRYLLANPPEGQQVPLLGLQATVALTTAAYLWALVRRRLAAPKRADRFREGIQQLLSGKLADADTTFRQLAWVDPWDPSAWIARGDACRRQGVIGRARRCYRRAGGVDVKGQFADLLTHRLNLLHNLTAAAKVAPVKAAIVPPSGPLASKKDRTTRKRVRKAASGN
jgi:hypothetical protein